MSARAGQPTQHAPWALVAAVTIAALAAAALGGLVLGRWAGERASEPAVIEVVIVDPALSAADVDNGWMSLGGFTGFGGLRLQPAADLIGKRHARLLVDSIGVTVRDSGRRGMGSAHRGGVRYARCGESSALYPAQAPFAHHPPHATA